MYGQQQTSCKECYDKLTSHVCMNLATQRELPTSHYQQLKTMPLCLAHKGARRDGVEPPMNITPKNHTFANVEDRCTDMVFRCEQNDTTQFA